MTPDDFKHTALDEAWRLRQMAIAHARNGFDLDEKTAMWVMTDAGWREIVASADYAASHMTTAPKHPLTLFGLPVRLTYGDAPDTPAIQLVMEPMVFARPHGTPRMEQ